MRKKTKEQKDKVMKAATQVFGAVGFDRASMDLIARTAQISKATLYNYSTSKEELFLEVMYESNETQFNDAHDCLLPDSKDPYACLLVFSKKLLSFIYSPAIISARRLAIREADRPATTLLCSERAQTRSSESIAHFLAVQMAAGRLRPADSVLAAQQLHALLESELLDIVHLSKPAPSVERTDACSIRALEAFWRIYAP